MTLIVDQARTALTDITVVATTLATAITAIDDARGGYPSSVPGAAPATPGPLPDYTGECKDCGDPRPCPTHDTPITLTQPERGAITPDEAADAYDALVGHIRQLEHHARCAANITTRWAYPASNQTDIATRLATIDATIWCRNCTRYGHHNPRRIEKSECEFCLSFRQSFGLDATEAIMTARDARGGRIYIQDIERILDRDCPGWRKNKPKGGKKKKVA